MLNNGDQLGPVGGTDRRRDVHAHAQARPRLVPQRARRLHPILPSATAGDFTFTDLIMFSGAHLP